MISKEHMATLLSVQTNNSTSDKKTVAKLIKRNLKEEHETHLLQDGYTS